MPKHLPRMKPKPKKKPKPRLFTNDANAGRNKSTTNTTVIPNVFVNVEADVDSIRNETFKGEEHMVVPIIALVEGVIHASNAAKPALVTNEELSKAPDGWNGRPVLLGHPKDEDGNAISANLPEVLESKVFGILFNTRVSGRKLKTEAWINLATVENMDDDVKDAVKRLQSGEIVEVSTGLYAISEKWSGIFNNKKYETIWSNIVPDHLAILPEGTIGACSVEDGCGGPRLNQSQIKENCGCAACTADPEDDMWKELAERAKCLPGHLFTSDYPEGMVSRDVHTLIQSALRRQFPGNYCYLLFFTKTDAIYEEYSIDTGFGFWSIPYTVNEDTSVEFTGDPTQVNILTRVEPVIMQEGPTNMANKTETSAGSETGSEDKAEVKAAAGSDATKDTKEVQASSGSKESENGNEAETEAQTQTRESEHKVEASQARPQKPLTAEEYISEAPEEIRDVLQSAMSTHQEQKKAIIKGLQETGRCEFSEPELSAMSLENLKKLQKVAQVPDYSGQAPANPANQMRAEERVAPAVLEVFPLKSKDDGGDSGNSNKKDAA